MDYLQYCHYTILKRSDDFWELTPKQLFKQLDIHCEVNNNAYTSENKDVEIEYL